MRLASRFGLTHSIRQERPLTNDELVKVVPSVFSEEKHNSRSDRYTYIPTITLLDKLREEGFQPFFACQSRVRDEDKRGHTKHMVRLRREGANKGTEVPEIILLNSHDGSSSYQMIPGMFRFVCTSCCPGDGRAFRNKFFPAIPLRFIRPKKISRSPPDICTGPCSFTPSRRTALKRVKVISRGRFSRSPHKVKTAAPATQRVMVKKLNR